MQIVKQLQEKTIECLTASFGGSFTEKDFQINQTRPEFEGDYTVVLFSLVKLLKSSPDALGETLGKALTEKHPDIFSSFNVLKGFLNLSVSDKYWLQFLHTNYHDESFGKIGRAHV